MTTAVTAMWVHGNAIVAEHPENLLALDYRGWGPEFQLERGTKSWFHLAIPTPLILDDQRPELVRVFLYFNAPESDGYISEVHVYDGSERLQVFENLFLVGDCRAFLISWSNAFTLPSPRLLHRGLSISFLYHAVLCAQEPRPFSYLSIAAAGGDFIVEAQRPLLEALTHQQTECEHEVAALRETFTSQRESLEALRKDIEALKGLTLEWRQQADARENEIMALRTQLQEEAQAREVLAQQVVTLAAQKTTQPRRKLGA